MLLQFFDAVGDINRLGNMDLFVLHVLRNVVGDFMYLLNLPKMYKSIVIDVIDAKHGFYFLYDVDMFLDGIHPVFQVVVIA
jgi:hypothetical protein